MLWIALIIACVLIAITLPRLRKPARPQRAATSAPIPATMVRNARKPDWVARELIRLAAWSPGLGCRNLAEVFNRRFAIERRMTVGKTYVATLLRQHRADILHLRRSQKHHIPRPQPKNRTWALDLTGKADLDARQHLILGLLDHGTRAALTLQAIADKRSLTILRELITAFRHYGIPRTLRVDNEACLSSKLLRAALALLRIRLQRTDPHCPWMNGRIERLFGTLKQRLDKIVIQDGLELTTKLIDFRTWYNHARPHLHLHGWTPAEAWAGQRKAVGEPIRFEAWEGRLVGWYFQPP